MNDQPFILVILGVTGDLAKKKILPALFNLYRKGALPPKARIVGFGRRSIAEDEFRAYVAEAVRGRIPGAVPEAGEFLEMFSYQQGDFHSENAYNMLAFFLHKLEHAWGQEAHYLFYLAVPPDLYEPIFRNLHSSMLYQRPNSDAGTRVLVEKPFGVNSETAETLERMLGKLFREQEIYRIDHYLAKEMVQNILAFRFSNDIFERTWNSEAIEKIEIKLWETLGVEQRGAFYDALGTLRDVGQNHLLQMLALLAMERPMERGATALHAKRAELLEKLVTPAQEEITSSTYRAQYAGYRSIAGVRPDSDTETYFKLRGFINSPRWEGVPITLEAGKRMHEQRKEVIVTYRHMQPCWCEGGVHKQNRIIFGLEPQEGITIEFYSKQPGLKLQQEQRTIDFVLRSGGSGVQYVEEYEKLLLDAILGDQTLFISTAEIRAMWRFVDPVVEAWEKGLAPLGSYAPDTSEALVTLP